MRISKLLVVMICSSLFGCSSMHATSHASNNSHKTKPVTQVASTAKAKKKNPIEVSFYPNGKNPHAPYVVLGKAVVSSYNKVGIKRQDATIHDAMRSLAASMGGDAVIDVRHMRKVVIGEVIAYQGKVIV